MNCRLMLLDRKIHIISKFQVGVLTHGEDMRPRNNFIFRLNVKVRNALS